MHHADRLSTVIFFKIRPEKASIMTTTAARATTKFISTFYKFLRISIARHSARPFFKSSNSFNNVPGQLLRVGPYRRM